MRTSRGVVVASGLNLILFLTAWVIKSLNQTSAAAFAQWLYFVFGAIGLVLAVYGFVTLAKGGDKNVKPAGALILLTFIPGVAVLIQVLTVIGGHPV